MEQPTTTAALPEREAWECARKQRSSIGGFITALLCFGSLCFLVGRQYGWEDALDSIKPPECAVNAGPPVVTTRPEEDKSVTLYREGVDVWACEGALDLKKCIDIHPLVPIHEPSNTWTKQRGPP